MKWMITGHVVENESSAGVPGLWVHVEDRDNASPDFQMNTVTDAQGSFSLTYERAGGEFDKSMSPELMVEVIAPPGRTLWQTSLRLFAQPTMPLDIRLGRRYLGVHAPGYPEDRVSSGVGLSKSALRIQKRGGRSWPSLPGYSPAGAPEQPIALERIHNVIIPIGDDAPELVVHVGEPARIPLRAPPALRPPAIVMRNTRPDGKPIDGRPPYTVLRASTVPAPVKIPQARISGVRVDGPVRIVDVVLCPVQYDADRNEYLFYADLRYEVRFDMARARRLSGATPLRALTREDAAMLEQALTVNDGVYRAKDLALIPASPREITFGKQYEHLIVTVDDFRKEFEALSRWKMKRGVQSRVVTLEDIKKGKVVADKDFTKGTLDDQEILRNFIRWAHNTWKTKYVLLGGDVNRIPIRKVAGMWAPCTRQAAEPTEQRGTVKYDDKTGVATLTFVIRWYNDGVKKSAILRPKGLPTRIPCSSSSMVSPRWYFEKFPPEKDDKTVTVHVVGPKEIIDNDFYFITEASHIPTDLYYESLLGTPGFILTHDRDTNDNRLEESLSGMPELMLRHDWDTNGNRLYAEFYCHDWPQTMVNTADFNPASRSIDVRVGRAPAQNASEAATFVTKVKAYESLGREDGQKVDTSYLAKSVIAAAFHRHDCDYEHQPGTDVWTITLDQNDRLPVEGRKKSEKMGDHFIRNYSWAEPFLRLIAHNKDTNIVIPFSFDEEVNPRWHYPLSHRFENGDVIEEADFGVVVVEGLDESSIGDLEGFYWDEIGKADFHMNFGDMIKTNWSEKFPEFGQIERYYMDTFDVDQSGHLDVISGPKVRDALNRGCHFVSLNSHGGSDGCCWLDSQIEGTFLASCKTLTNDRKLFIAYAVSCSTAQPDTVSAHSFGEQLVINPGGAVAYVGATRTDWPDEGGQTQLGFWDILGNSKRLGDAASDRRPGSYDLNRLWVFFTQILYGDPEMPIWSRMPREYRVGEPIVAKDGLSLVVAVHDKEESKPLQGHVVTLLYWPDAALNPRYYHRVVTNAKGEAKFSLKGLPSNAKVELTVSGTDYIPHLSSIQIN